MLLIEHQSELVTERLVVMVHQRAIIRRICVATATSVCLLLASPAFADVRIVASPGGTVDSFLSLFEVLRASGQRVVIDGPCLSACTLVLATVPRNRICVTQHAVLGFHAARSVDQYGRTEPEPEASEIMLESYPLPVQRWIRRHGGLTSRLLLLRGRELAAMFPHCR